MEMVCGAMNSYSDILVPYEGLINENYYKLQSRETELISNIEYYTGRSINPYNKKYENFIGLLLKSKYDGVKPEDNANIKLGDTDFAITLDISGSMSSPLDNKKTIIPRIELAKKALLTMIDNLKDGNQLSISVFNNISTTLIPLSPKSEVLFLKEKIKNIGAGGGTDLYEALKGGYETLNISKNKFKRIIIITDGWDDDKNFMNYAKTVTNNGVGISVIAIDTQSNSKLFEKFSKLGGCNYFIATEEKDLEKYLIHQFHYMTFVSSYNMKLNFESDECDIIKAIGTNSEDNNINNLCNIPSCFPSDLKFNGEEVYQEGGLILLKIKPKSDNNKNGVIKLNLKLEYSDNEDKTYIQNYPIEFEINESEFYSNDYMKKGIALYYYGKIRRKIAKYFNSDVKFTTGGPVIENVDVEKKKKLYNFLRRDNENIDKAIIFFNQNYFNDIVDNQKEKYLETLNEKYNAFLKEIEN